MAVRTLANIWARIIHAMWLKQERYNGAVFYAAQQAHGAQHQTCRMTPCRLWRPSFGDNWGALARVVVKVVVK
jgi:hypothetical protein